jgi:hypothetical protein
LRELPGNQHRAVETTARSALRNAFAAVNANFCRRSGRNLAEACLRCSQFPQLAARGQAHYSVPNGGRGKSHRQGEVMSELVENLRKFAKQRLETLDLLPDYLTAVIEHWNDIFFSSIPMLPFVAWWYLGEPPMAIKAIVFMWMFVAAGYYAWRKEHLKNASDDFTGYIYGAASMVPDTSAQLLGEHWVKIFVGVRINNVGTPRSIHTWQVSWRKGPGQPGFHLADGMMFNGQVGNLPDGIHGYNLHGDTRLFATGETRDGWIAFDGGANFEAEMLANLSLGFTDAFNKFHEVSSLSNWALKRK